MRLILIGLNMQPPPKIGPKHFLERPQGVKSNVNRFVEERLNELWNGRRVVKVPKDFCTGLSDIFTLMTDQSIPKLPYRPRPLP
jgi:hypothetical protein